MCKFSSASTWVWQEVILCFCCSINIGDNISCHCVTKDVHILNNLTSFLQNLVEKISLFPVWCYKSSARFRLNETKRCSRKWMAFSHLGFNSSYCETLTGWMAATHQYTKFTVTWSRRYLQHKWEHDESIAVEALKPVFLLFHSFLCELATIVQRNTPSMYVYIFCFLQTKENKIYMETYISTYTIH